MSDLEVFVNREKASLYPISQSTPIKGSPGWTQQRLGFSSGLLVAIEYRYPELGIRYADAFSNASDVTEVFVPTVGFVSDIYPGAGLAVSIVPNLGSTTGTKSPFLGPLIAPGMGRLPDPPYTGAHGSARNGMTSRARAALLELDPAERWLSPTAAHILRWMEFQRRRPYQNADLDGGFAEYPASKTPAESMMVWSPALDRQIPDPVWKYDALHFSNQEECAFYVMTRDPRAYDLMSRMIRHARRFDGYLKGPNPSLYDMSRVKGWWCAALGRGGHCAALAGDNALLEEIRASIFSALETIEAQFDTPGRITPSSQAPSGHHIKNHASDSSWMIAILAHGLDLVARGVPQFADRATALRDRALDVIDEVCWDGETLYADVTVDGKHRETWKPYSKGDGTAKWIAQAMIQCDRFDSPALRWIQNWREVKKKPVVTWDDYMPRSVSLAR